MEKIALINLNLLQELAIKEYNTNVSKGCNYVNKDDYIDGFINGYIIACSNRKENKSIVKQIALILSNNYEKIRF